MVAVEKRILVVDDEEIVRESCRRVLTEAGYAVRTAANGRDALRVCRAEHFDVMLTDLRMADMDGMEVIRAVTQEHPTMRVVVITGYPSRESVEQAEELGVADYLEKPLSPVRLSEATAAALSRPQARPASVAATLPAAAPVEMQPRARVEPAVAPQTAGGVTRLVVTGSIGFLLGVGAAYFVAPSHGLAYLLVGTAIASGTLLGLFSDALFARNARTKSRGASDALPPAAQAVPKRT